MELRDLAGIVRRRWLVALVGLVLAIGLGFVTYLKRSDNSYTSTTTVFVTQQGFPFASPTTSGTGVNPGELSTLAFLYAQIAQSDSILRSIGAPFNSISATVATSGAFGSGNALPFINLTGTATTAGEAQQLATSVTSALRRYVIAGEQAANTPAGQRVDLQVLNAAPRGKPVAARTRVVILPGVVFLTVILVFLGFIFMLENMSKPRETKVEPRPADELARGVSPVRVGGGSESAELIDPRAGRSGLLRRT